MKKILSIVFLFIFIYNLLGYYTVFKIVQYQIRYEIEQKIKQSFTDDELVIIAVSLDDTQSFHWVKTGKEFSYKGEMYDIVKQEIKNGQIHYYCIADFKEKELFENLDKHIQNYIAGKPEQKKEAQNILKKLTNVYLFQALFVDKPNEYPYYVKYKNYLNTYKSICIETPNPPPENSSDNCKIKN